MTAASVGEHAWSGWPRAWCLACGQVDRTEECATSHEHAVLDPDQGICIVPCQNGPCPGAGA